MDNPKVEVKTGPLGAKGVFAKERIEAGEVMSEWDGEIYRLDGGFAQPRHRARPVP